MLTRLVLTILLLAMLLTATAVMAAPPPVVVDVGDHIDYIVIHQTELEGQQYWCLDSTTGTNDWFDCGGKTPADCFIADQYETVSEAPPFVPVHVTFYDGCGLSVSIGGPQARPFLIEQIDKGYRLWFAGEFVDFSGKPVNSNGLLAQIGYIAIHQLSTGEFQVNITGDGVIWGVAGKVETARAATLGELNTADLHGPL